MNITQKVKSIDCKPHLKKRLYFKEFNCFGAEVRQTCIFLREDLILIKEGVS